jgi:Outer membrane protein beta-barrel domain
VSNVSRRKALSFFVLLSQVCVMSLASVAQKTLSAEQVQGYDFSSSLNPPLVPSDSSTTSSSNDEDDDAGASISSGAAAASVSTLHRETGVDWGHLVASSLAFLTVSHSFRYASEATTRRSFHQSYFPHYGAAIANLHGWGDGDPFLVNYVGHPMEGAVAGFIWQHNDRAFRTVEFGRNRRYWKERMRGMAFAYVYSVQFEIGPISEASIGHIQGMYPQIGFVDHVITPIVGTGWAIAEDSIDRIIVQRIEQHYSNPYIRLFARGLMNPARSFANVMEFQVPWHRDDRPGVFKPFPENAFWVAENKRRVESTPVNPPPGVAPFDFSFHATYTDFVGNSKGGSCMGGGGTAGFRIAEDWQIILDVGGCKMLNFGQDWSGDTLTYMVGPRWTSHNSGKWTPHVQALVGGTKITQEYQNPVLKADVADWHPDNDEGRTAKHDYYSTDWTRDGFALSAGAGVDYRFNNALALRVADLSYAHYWVSDINNVNYRNAVQLSGGLVLRMGTW